MLPGLCGCSLGHAILGTSWRYHLERVGLEPLSEEDARIPLDERGRYIPCRVMPGYPTPALPPHRAGYLLVAVQGAAEEDAEAMMDALNAWRPGTFIKVKARRNHYCGAPWEWWEKVVVIWQPD
jgi:hypothetical protein